MTETRPADFATQWPQLRQELKAELKAEIRADLNNLIRQEVATILPKINKKIEDSFASMRRDVKTTTDSLKRDISEKAPVDAAANNMALTIIQKQQVAEAAIIACRGIENRILKKFDKMYGGELNKVMEWSSYQMQDTDDMLDKYRKQVITDEVRGQKYLTDSKGKSKVITEHMSFVFGHDD